jgi:putative transposase
VLISRGQSVAEAIRSIGVSEVTYYRWRQEFGGLPFGCALFGYPRHSEPQI